MLTWVDLLALFSLSLGLALGYRGGWPWAFAGGGVVAYVLLAQLGLAGPLLGLSLGLLAGLLGKSLPLPHLPQGLEKNLGTLGGLLLGLFLALSLWAGYPFERVASTGGLRYPSVNLPTPIYQGVSQSPFAREAFRLAWQTPWLRKALALEGQHPR
ncbi:hypothetical protein [Thermus caliditerrae]|uniref:hypothetical protein n=1 Tax=Thermus caliditerrae TaxID=1330700 RepID=UPI00056EDD2E|nr:hypothetical protein [Thermus caliditerrae]